MRRSARANYRTLVENRPAPISHFSHVSDRTSCRSGGYRRGMTYSPSRRRFLAASATIATAPLAGCVARPMPIRSPYASAIPDAASTTLVNDVHSQLNLTRVARIEQPVSVDELAAIVARAGERGQPIAIAGGRHAMGGQQFADSAVLIDTRRLNRVIDFDRDRGVITVDGGIQWPQLIGYLAATQSSGDRQWGIYQKQTGADRLSLAGALSCNAHGRGLNQKPIVSQVESFDLIAPDGPSAAVRARTTPHCFVWPSAGTACSGPSAVSH